MKATFSALAIGGLLGLASLGAHAADGTILITGTVTDTTCSISGNAAGTPASKTITLPTVSAGTLAAAGQTTGTSQPTDLEFKLSVCSSGTKAIASFENGPMVDQLTGNLTNSGTAENV